MLFFEALCRTLSLEYINAPLVPIKGLDSRDLVQDSNREVKEGGSLDSPEF